MKKEKIIYIILFIIILIILFGIVLIPNIKKTSTNKNITNNDLNENSNNIEITADMNNITEIKEKMFIQQISDIFVNLNQYNGKTIKLEGFIYHYQDETDNSNDAYYVMRKTPGCCGNDGSAGFEIIWDKEYPQDNEWVEATGVIKAVDKGGYYGEVPVLYLTNLETKQERGADFVTQ